MKFCKIIIFFFFVSVSLIGQNKYPQDYFGSPMNIPLQVAGSFGELRPNHFHSGIDFRTQKKEGFPVLATADGYISRIKISTGGYGKSIYIDHPNGYTSVYAHLQSGYGIIQDYIKTEQYAKQSYEVEMYPKPIELLIKKGDTIGYSGNTGSSSGPHLHFEIRDTKSEKVINPLFFGYDKVYADTESPKLINLIGYPSDEVSQINGSANSTLIPMMLQPDGTYLANKVIASGKIGFGINAYDTSNNDYGKHGLYKIETFLNGQPYFTYEFDSFSFDETIHINDYIDFQKYQEQKQRFQKLFIGNLFATSIVKNKVNNGFVNLLTNFTLNYKVVMYDYHGNQTVLNIPIYYGNLPITTPKVVKKTPYLLKSQNEHSYAEDNISVVFAENTFYKDFYIDFKVQNNELTLHNEKLEAVAKPFFINFNVAKIDKKEREKMFIGNIDNGRLEYNFTFKKDDVLSIKTKKLGKFILAKDTIAPRIYSPNFKKDAKIDANTTLKVSISDDMSGIASYNAYLNGKWILMEYETKNNRLTYNFIDKKHVKGKNEFKIIVKDFVGNSTTFESTFVKNN